MRNSGMANFARCRQRRFVLFGVLLATTGLSSHAFAQSAEPQAASTEAPAQVQQGRESEIVVTGTLIRGLDTRLPIPVSVITQDDLKARGYQNVAEALTRNSIATGDVANASAGYTQGARTVSLFGFGPGFTKFLVEGRPAANYPALYNNQSVFVDIGAIPSALVDRVEILPGGQSSLYGSDAIAGVVNIQLKRKFDGPMAEARLGLYERGGGRSLRLALADGFESGNFSLIAGVQYENIKPLWAFQRKLTRSAFDRGSTPWEPSGAYGLPRSDFTYVSPPAGSCDAVAGQFNNSVGLHTMPDGGSYCANFDYNTQTLANSEKRLQGYSRASYDFGSHELYGDILFNRSTARYTAAILPRTYFSPFFHSDELGETVRLTREFSPEEYGGLDKSLSRDRLTSVAVSAGLRGDLSSAWAYDVTLQHTRQDLSMSRVAYLADPINAYFGSILGPQLGEFDDPFNGPVPIHEPDLARFFQPVPTATFDGFHDLYRAKANTRTTWGRALVSSKNLFALPGGNAGIALAVEGASESWKYDPDPRAGTGVFLQELSDVSGNGSRDSLAAVSELQLPVVDFASLSGSLRYDRYFTKGADTGKASWNVAAEVRPVGELVTLRARYGTAFKAPTLSDLFQGASTSIGASTDYRRCAELGYPITDSFGCPYRDSTFVQKTAGNVDLKPLTAKVLNLGATFIPTNGIRIDVDYLRWRIDNGVTTETADTLLRDDALCAVGEADPARCAQIANLIVRAPDGSVESIYTEKRNLSRAWVEALNVEASAAHEFGDLGILTLSANWTYLLNRESQETPEAVIVDELQDPRYYMGARTKLNAWLAWHRKAIDLSIGFERLGRTPNFLASMGGYVNGGAKLPSWTVWTLSGAVQVTKKASVSLAINNLFDSDPPLDFSSYGFSSSPFSSSADVNGRQFLLQVNYGF